MKKAKLILIVLNLVVVLFLFNRSVLQKEKLLEQGRLILLELAPVDPRSLMQGDYMRLSYAIARFDNDDSIPPHGFMVVTLSDSSVASKVRIQTSKKLLNNSELLIRYSSSYFNLNLGAESYFFQEGTAEKYAAAKYGGLRVDNDGNSVLTGLYDSSKKLIDSGTPAIKN